MYIFKRSIKEPFQKNAYESKRIKTDRLEEKASFCYTERAYEKKSVNTRKRFKKGRMEFIP